MPKSSALAEELPQLRVDTSRRPAARARAAHHSAYRRSAGYNRTWFIDPANIEVAKVYAKIDFHYGSDGCVHNPVYHDRYVDVLDNSGWRYGHQEQNVGANCNRGFTSVYAHMYNAVFPACSDRADVYFDGTLMYGYPSGNLGATQNAYKGGSRCAELLTFQQRIVRTY